VIDGPEVVAPPVTDLGAFVAELVVEAYKKRTVSRAEKSSHSIEREINKVGGDTGTASLDSSNKQVT
jgi:hypothetical protein